MTDQLPVLNRQQCPALTRYPEKIVQFGTGNFLKGFFNWMVQKLNERTDFQAGIVAVKLRPGNEQQVDEINAQDGLFTVNVRGIENGVLVDHYDVVGAQNRALSPYRDYADYIKLAESPSLQWVVSNTTEAGICFDECDSRDATPAQTFPAKLTALLYRRYRHFDGDPAKGLKIFCCELIENNAGELKRVIGKYADLWQLEAGFGDWLDSSCCFYNTLVDRIVTGKPESAERINATRRQLAYIDNELIETESYYQWVIQRDGRSDAELQQLFPPSAGLNIVLTDDLTLYRQRKVRILNGAHTGCVALARLMGIETVYQGMQDPELREFMQSLVYDEICPTIAMPQAEVKAYAESILERFQNPFLHHEWNSIGLNSLSKWRARLLPVLLQVRTESDEVPTTLATSLAALLVLYRGSYRGRPLVLQDDPALTDWLSNAWREAGNARALVKKALASMLLWGQDLSADTDLVEAVAEAVKQLDSLGVRESLQLLLATSKAE